MYISKNDPEVKYIRNLSKVANILMVILLCMIVIVPFAAIGVNISSGVIFYVSCSYIACFLIAALVYSHISGKHRKLAWEYLLTNGSKFK